MLSLSGSGEWISAIFILVGAVITLISSIGLIRLPDVYTRSHAGSKSSTLGVLTILTGALLYFLIVEGNFNIRLILVIFFVFLTAPVSAHMITRTAYRNGVPMAKSSMEDVLKDYLKLNQKDSVKRN